MAKATCTNPGCPNEVHARALCNMHYRRLISPPPKPKPSTAERFYAKVDKDAEGGCWKWLGTGLPAGYGQIWFVDRKIYAHRLSYMLHVGPIPDGLTIDHLCRNRWCVNPDHLEPVTGAENTRRAAAARTDCVNGHPLSGPNLYVDPRNNRQCRTCRSAAIERFRARRLSAS